MRPAPSVGSRAAICRRRPNGNTRDESRAALRDAFSLGRRGPDLRSSGHRAGRRRRLPSRGFRYHGGDRPGRHERFDAARRSRPRGNVSEWGLDGFAAFDSECWNAASLVDPMCWEENAPERSLLGGEWTSSLNKRLAGGALARPHRAMCFSPTTCIAPLASALLGWGFVAPTRKSRDETERSLHAYGLRARAGLRRPDGANAPPTGQIVLYVATDAPLPAARDKPVDPDEPPALFDACASTYSRPERARRARAAPTNGSSIA